MKSNSSGRPDVPREIGHDDERALQHADQKERSPRVVLGDLLAHLARAVAWISSAAGSGHGRCRVRSPRGGGGSGGVWSVVSRARVAARRPGEGREREHILPRSREVARPAGPTPRRSSTASIAGSHQVAPQRRARRRCRGARPVPPMGSEQATERFRIEAARPVLDRSKRCRRPLATIASRELVAVRPEVRRRCAPEVDAAPSRRSSSTGGPRGGCGCGGASVLVRRIPPGAEPQRPAEGLDLRPAGRRGAAGRGTGGGSRDPEPTAIEAAASHQVPAAPSRPDRRACARAAIVAAPTVGATGRGGAARARVAHASTDHPSRGIGRAPQMERQAEPDGQPPNVGGVVRRALPQPVVEVEDLEPDLQ